MTDSIRPETIVVAVDGSEHAERALRWAVEQAHLERRPLLVVTAASHRLPLEDARAVADDAVMFAREQRPQLGVRHHVLYGDPRDLLTDLSAVVHLVVMGARGRGQVASRLLGSVSAAVTRRAYCPVVVCRPALAATPRRGVLIGADGSAESVPVIEFAFRQASLREEPLTVMHSTLAVLATGDGAPTLVPTETDLQRERLLLAESVAGFGEKFPDVRVRRELGRGFAEDCLAEDADEWGLIVVGRRPVDSLARLLVGSVATAVLERSSATVAVVPEAARA